MCRSIVFVSDQSPNTKLASAVIVYRHLCRLEADGWRINLVLHEGDMHRYEGRPNWHIKVLPMRRQWYPPFRPYGVLATVRFQILLREVSRFITAHGPKVVIGHLQGAYFSE